MEIFTLETYIQKETGGMLRTMSHLIISPGRSLMRRVYGDLSTGNRPLAIAVAIH